MLSLVVLLLQPNVAPASPPRDPRSVVLLDEDCLSSLDHRQLTLFANGTVRLREGTPGAERMSLIELAPPDRDVYVRQLAELDWSETESSVTSPSGEWTESCVLTVAPTAEPALTLRYDRYATGSLALERARRVVNDLIERSLVEARSVEIPSAYKPMVGDRLQRNDGILFEVVGFTSDGHGVELDGVELPLTLYVDRDEIRRVFRRIVPRRDGP